MSPRFLIAGFAVACSISAVSAQTPPIAELNPRTVTFPRGEISLKDAIALLHRQTGNLVEDRRTHPTNPMLTLPGDGTFWPILDAISKQSGIGFSAYQPDGSVALVDGPYHPLRTNYSGLFRFASKRIVVSRDDEAQASHCLVALDVAWEPRFQPLYLTLDRAAATFPKGKQKLERQTPRNVAGMSCCELDLRMKAPDRAVPAIEALEGSIHVIGAPKMLEFTFTRMDQSPTTVQEGVKAGVSQVKASRDRWAVDVHLEYPSDAIIPLESYQTWMDNNRVWLEWSDARTKTLRKLEPTGEAPLPVAKGTKIRYYFTPKDTIPLPTGIADAALRYRTPNRVVEFTVPFAFRDLPLP